MAHEVTFIPGDGTGPELAEATRRVLEATGVEFAWDEHPAGEDVYERGGQPVPRPHARLDQAHRRRHQGPDDDAGRLGLPLGQRAAAQGARPLRLHPPLQGLRGRAHPLPRDRHRDRAREHRGPLRGDRVRVRTPSTPSKLRAFIAGARRLEDPRALGHLDQADLRLRLRADRARRVRLRARERPPQGHRGPQGQHHEALRRALPRRRAQGRARTTPTSSSRTGSSTTSATSSSRARRSTT